MPFTTIGLQKKAKKILAEKKKEHESWGEFCLRLLDEKESLEHWVDVLERVITIIEEPEKEMTMHRNVHQEDIKEKREVNEQLEAYFEEHDVG